MRILITGASGMLGSSLAVELSKSHEVFGTGNTKMNLPFSYKPFNLSNKSYNELIEWSNPDLIIHCAALTDGNYCENNVLEAFDINGYSMKKLLNSSDEKVKIIYISTDAVFPSKLHMARESDFTSPENVYGKSKELGEFFLMNCEREFLIIRTTIVGLNSYTNNKGFLEWIIGSSKLNKKISLFDDVLFTPISIWDLINEIKFLVNLNEYKFKILHITGNECLTKYKFGIELLKKLSIDVNFVDKGFISNFADRAKRSNDQTLSIEIYEKLYNRSLPKFKETLESIKKGYNEIN